MNFIRGILAICWIAINTVLVWIPLTWWIIQRTWTRGEALSRLRKRMDKIVWWWPSNNRKMIDVLGITKPTITWNDDAQMTQDEWYLVVCNHQSWTDILLLQCYLYGAIPPLKFFTKQQLIWVPGIGVAMYVLGFPYVKRVTKAQIKANPKLRNADKENVMQACEIFKNHPTSVLNFVEGTRNTPEKHARQGSEYEHLLRPKAGGLGYVIEGMGDHLQKLIDVTIVYPSGVPSFWDFVQGKCQKVEIEVTPHVIPPEVKTDDASARRTALAQWIKTIWQQKDQRITDKLNKAA